MISRQTKFIAAINPMPTRMQQGSKSAIEWLSSWQQRSLESEAVTLPVQMYSSPEIYCLEQLIRQAIASFVTNGGNR